MLLALVAFWLPRSAWTVLLLVTLNRSIDGTKCAAPERDRTLDVEVEVLERRQAVLADGSSSTVGVPPPFGSA